MPASPEIRARSKRYAALAGAWRALAEQLDRAEVDRAGERGRSIRSRLQALHAEAGERGPDPADLAEVDRLLDGLSDETLGTLRRLVASGGAALFARLAGGRPETLRGLAEVLLEGDLERDADLRLLEFLVTQRSSGRRGASRAVVRAPFEAVPALERAYAAVRERVDAGAPAAVRQIADATSALQTRSDVDDTRDRMRRYKRELGIGMLHPGVFAAVVAYNVAMSNRVETLIHGRALHDELAHDLLAAGAADTDDAGDSLFRSEGFDRLVAALTLHVRGEPCADAAAMRLARECDAERLTPGELEAFEAPEEEANARLARAAVALGLLLPRLPELSAALGELDVDPERVAGPWPAELWRSMTATAQRLLAQGRYAEAQRLAALRARHLREHRGSRPAAGDSAPRRHAGGAAARGRPVPASSPLLWQVSGGFALVALLLLVALWQWPAREARLLASEDLTRLSPYLEAAYRSSDDGEPRLVATVGAQWRELGDPDRQRAVAELGERIEAEGIRSVILVDRRHQIQGRYQDGETLWVAPSRLPAAY